MRLATWTFAVWVASGIAFSCAHAPKAQPIVISAHVLDGAGMTFEATSLAIHMACPSAENCAFTRAQTLAWNDFAGRWDAAYRLGVEQWKDAKTRLDQPAADQAAALLTGLLGELATFQFVAQGAK